ncbi:hypothetical protein ACU686_40050 [Yinghuangia aomiensis]
MLLPSATAQNGASPRAWQPESTLCPVCRIPPAPGATTCPDCREDLAPLLFLRSRADRGYNAALADASTATTRRLSTNSGGSSPTTPGTSRPSSCSARCTPGWAPTRTPARGLATRTPPRTGARDRRRVLGGSARRRLTASPQDDTAAAGSRRGFRGRRGRCRSRGRPAPGRLIDGGGRACRAGPVGCSAYFFA